jgi:outer membrane protein assembly factor BamE (lipoprotein component of BamABCDE complex)
MGRDALTRRRALPHPREGTAVEHDVLSRQIAGMGTAQHLIISEGREMPISSKTYAVVIAAMLVALGFAFAGAVASHDSIKRSDLQASAADMGDVRHVPLRASRLYEGMTVAQVKSIMGEPIGRKAFADAEVLTFSDEGVQARVTFLDDRLVGVSLDLAGIDEEALPRFARPVKAGVTRNGVALLLGKPVEDRQWKSLGISLEQMVFKSQGADEISVFLANGVVVKVQTGDSPPADLLRVTLPVDPIEAEAGARIREAEGLAPRLRIGMAPQVVNALNGSPCQTQTSSFKGLPVQYLLYELRGGSGYLRLTFTGGALTEFEVWRQVISRDLGDTASATCGN